MTPSQKSELREPASYVSGTIPARALRRTMDGAIRLYQLTLSSLVGQNCRHLPTCSQYGREAIARHGAWGGGWMLLGRITRCRPGGTHGVDNVPAGRPVGAVWHRPWRWARWR